MGISQFPAAAVGGGGDVAFASTLAAMSVTYEHVQAFDSGIYDVEVVPATTQVGILLIDASSLLVNTSTTSGIVSIQLNTPATRLYITGLEGGTAGAIVKMTKVAEILSPDDIGNGTLDTINATGTYNQTGRLAVLAFGGGSAGGKGGISYDPGGQGGASGGVNVGVVYTNGPTTVTVGAKGVAATSNNTNIVAPNQSSFGNLLTSSTNNFFWTSGAGNQGGGNSGGGNGNASRIFTSFNGNSTTGGGASGGKVQNYGNATGGGSSGGGSGIGTGGRPGAMPGGNGSNVNPTTASTAATGKAAGGGGGNATGNNNPNAVGRFGSDGSDGVVYVLRGF
jgi:hypothetical protein